MRRAVFFDRDDTLIACNAVAPGGDLGDPALVAPLPGVRDACHTLARAGFTLIVVSNQGGVARGAYNEHAVHAVNQRVNDLLGGVIRAFYFCPFHPRGVVPAYTREHPWRKPAPGMILAAAAEHDIDLASSWLVGDAPRDVEAGRAAGCRSVLVRDAGATAALSPALERDPCVFIVASVAHAAALIMRESGA